MITVLKYLALFVFRRQKNPFTKAGFAQYTRLVLKNLAI